MDKKIPLNKQYRILLIAFLMLMLGAILIMFYICGTANENQVFTDVVIEYTSRYGLNKSAERNMFYIFSFIGILAIIIIIKRSNWLDECTTVEDINNSSYVLAALCTTCVINYVLYKRISPIAFGAVAVAVTTLIRERKKATIATASFFLTVYALIGIYRAYVMVGGTRAISLMIVSVVALVITLVIVLVPHSDNIFVKTIMLSQLCVPLALLVFLMSSYYSADGTITVIDVPRRVKYFIFLLVTLFIGEALIKLFRGWSSAHELKEVLSFGSCVSIMSFNRYSGTGCVTDLDLHHNFENVIGYSQIFELGQSPFTEYIPVSGMYSIIHGWIFKIFGGGLAAYYHLTTNLFYLLVILVIVLLLKKQIEAEWVLFISLYFWVTDYNRITLIVPTILLLTMPCFIKRYNLWLKVWFLSSFVHGLYYPVFGAAVCLGFLPMGIWQIHRYIKTKTFKKDIKKVSFWASWIICILPVALGIPLLIGTAKHMLAMSAQTIYADGLTRFGQVIPETFLPYIGNWSFRVLTYYVFSYLIIISLVWLSVFLFYRCGQKGSIKTLTDGNAEGAMVSISIAIMLLVSFSYTVVRFDVGDLYSRSDGVVKASFIVLIILIGRYINKNNKYLPLLLGFAVAILSVVSAEGIMNAESESKLSAYYVVPEGDVHISNTDVRLGECFINTDSYNYIVRINEYVKTLDKDLSYLGLVDSFGLDYLCNIKGSSVIEIFNTIKGYSATEETVNLLRENGAIVGRNINPDSNYYLYHWLVTSGEYIWNDELRLFIPNDGSVTKEQVLELHKNIDLSYADAVPLGRTAGSWGSSYDTLKDILTEVSLDYSLVEQNDGWNISLEKSIDGDEADFIYVEFDNLTNDVGYVQTDNNNIYQIKIGKGSLSHYLLKEEYNPGEEVTLYWFDENGEKHSITCDMDEGKLLIPIGSGTGWLLNEHSSLYLEVTRNGETIEAPTIANVDFLKLREID